MSDDTKREPRKPRPARLKAKGRRLWDDVTSTYDLRADELAVLEHAARELDLIERLERELDGNGLTVAGSMGQLVAHPLIGELRQHRATAQRLLAQLKLPDDSGDGRADAAAAGRSTSAREAANARWRRSGT